MLGTSMWTSIVGYCIIALTVAHQVFVEQGMPHDLSGWITLAVGIVTGVGLRLAKDANVSNAPNPTVAKPVS